MFKAKPELLNSSEKSILFTELVSFESIQEATDFVIDKEVDSILRESHLKQFKWLESKLGIPLRKDLSSFSNFIEITERRNLFVHGNGVVSRQYLESCIENEVDGIEQVKLGQKLNAEPGYFNKCYSTLFEIGVKLGQVIWRKLLPTEIQQSDAHLNKICFNLLLKGQFRLALNLLSFATETLKKHHDQEVVFIFTINKALAYYLSDKKDDCKRVIDSKDWSATSDKFKLAIAVLNEDYDKAITVMKSIGANNSHIGKEAYREWPLFTNLRKSLKFKETYNGVFGEEFIYVEKVPRRFEDIIDEMRQSKLEAEKQKVVDSSVLTKTEGNSSTGT